MSENGTYRWTFDKNSKKSFDPGKLPKIALIAAIVLLLIIGAST